MMKEITELMQSQLFIQMELLFRIIVAGICGAFIGLERKNRLKNAGLKTHLLVALTSALMVVISKYGFLMSLLRDFRWMLRVLPQALPVESASLEQD